MCLIAYLKDKTFVDLEALESAHENNPHGWGITYANGGRLFTCRKDASFNVFKDALNLIPDDVPLSIHFRWATHGDKSENNIHPFDILFHETDGIDLCMMHNGVISSTSSLGSTNEKRSDTALYVEYVLKPIIKENPKIIYNTGFQTLVSRDIGSGNKFLFMDGNGGVVIINPSSGHFPLKDTQDIWYSNTYSLKSSYRTTKVGPANYYSSFGDGYADWYQHKNTEPKHVVGTPNVPVEKSSWEKNNSGIWEKRKRWEERSTPVTNHAGRYVSENASAKPTPMDLSIPETATPKHIVSLLLHNEKLLKPIGRNGQTMGFGWVTSGNNLVSRWDETICKLHKEWYQELRDEESKKATVIELKYDPSEDMYDSSDFRIMSLSEILAWVDKHPKDAAKWVAKAGYFGSVISLEDFITTGGGWEAVTDFIFERSRNINSDTTLFQKALDDYATQEVYISYHA